MPYKDPQKRKEQVKKYYLDHKEEISERNKCEKYKKRKKEYNINNKEKVERLHKLRCEKRIKLINTYKSNPCSICNKKYNLECMDFHHIDPSNKKFSIGCNIYNNRSIKALIEEISKCILICANCHTKLNTTNECKYYPKWFLEYRSKLECEICKTKDSLEFHHMERSIKIDKVTAMARNTKKYTENDVLNEISKCKVLCSNCHRIIEYKLKQENKRK